jgi:hypothetical protein
MSTTTTAKEAEGLSYLELKDLLEKKKEAEIDKVTKELTAAEGIVASLRAQLVNLGVTPAPAAPKAKRGRRKANLFNPGKTTKVKKSGKRGAVGEAITAFVTSKGKAGAKVSDIAAHLSTKPANVTAFFYAKANKTKFKKVAPATFAKK